MISCQSETQQPGRQERPLSHASRTPRLASRTPRLASRTPGHYTEGQAITLKAGHYTEGQAITLEARPLHWRPRHYTEGQGITLKAKVSNLQGPRPVIYRARASNLQGQGSTSTRYQYPVPAPVPRTHHARVPHHARYHTTPCPGTTCRSQHVPALLSE